MRVSHEVRANFDQLYFSPTVRDEFAMHARTLRTMRTFRDSSRRFGESIHKCIANSSHPSEIGALVLVTLQHGLFDVSVKEQSFSLAITSYHVDDVVN